MMSSKFKNTIFNYLLLISIILLTPVTVSCHPEPLAPQEARVLIINPAAESILETNAVEVRAFIENFTIVNKVGQNNTPAMGHIIYYKDATPPMVQGKEALTAQGTYMISTGLSYTWTNVQAGKHIFWVQLVNNDNTPLEPPAAVNVPITIIQR